MDLLDEMINKDLAARAAREGWQSSLEESMTVAKHGAKMKVEILMLENYKTISLEELLQTSTADELEAEKSCLDIVKKINDGQLVSFEASGSLDDDWVQMLFKDGVRAKATGCGKARWLASFTRADKKRGFFCLNPGMKVSML